MTVFLHELIYTCLRDWVALTIRAPWRELACGRSPRLQFLAKPTLTPVLTCRLGRNQRILLPMDGDVKVCGESEKWEACD